MKTTSIGCGNFRLRLWRLCRSLLHVCNRWRKWKQRWLFEILLWMHTGVSKYSPLLIPLKHLVWDILYSLTSSCFVLLMQVQRGRASHVCIEAEENHVFTTCDCFRYLAPWFNGLITSASLTFLWSGAVCFFVCVTRCYQRLLWPGLKIKHLATHILTLDKLTHW